MSKTNRPCQSSEYARAHRIVKSLWGPARNYPCVKCESTADDWAYDWCDDTSENYSLCPEFYMPLCRACHAWFDKAGESHRNRQGRAFRAKPVVRQPKTEAEWEAFLREQRRMGISYLRKVSQKTA